MADLVLTVPSKSGQRNRDLETPKICILVLPSSSTLFLVNWLWEFDVFEFDQKNNLITLNILITSLQDNVDYREKLHINHFWELKG